MWDRGSPPHGTHWKVSDLWLWIRVIYSVRSIAADRLNLLFWVCAFYSDKHFFQGSFESELQRSMRWHFRNGTKKWTIIHTEADQHKKQQQQSSGSAQTHRLSITMRARARENTNERAQSALYIDLPKLQRLSVICQPDIWGHYQIAERRRWKIKLFLLTCLG